MVLYVCHISHGLAVEVHALRQEITGGGTGEDASVAAVAAALVASKSLLCKPTSENAGRATLPIGGSNDEHSVK